MGSLADDDSMPGPTRRRPFVEAILEDVDPDDREALLAVLRDSRVGSLAIGRWLQAHGYLTDSSDPGKAVTRWRAKHCRDG